MAHDLFISYATEDKTVADAVCAILESRNIRCWIAPRDVRPGTVYSEALINALDSSRLLVLVFSSNSNKSPHVMREMERVVSKGIPIIPFRIEDIEPSKSIEYYIGNTHWLDALTPPLKKHLNYLADNVELLLDKIDSADIGIQPASTVFSKGASASPLPETPLFQRLREFITAPKRFMGIIVAVLLILVAGAYALNMRDAAKQALQQQDTASINGLLVPGNNAENDGAQQPNQAGTPGLTPNQDAGITSSQQSTGIQGPAANQVIIPGGDGNISQNVQTTVANPVPAADTTAAQMSTPDFEALDKSDSLAQQAFNMHMSMGDPQEILALCNQALELNNNNDFAYYVRGANYYFHLNQSSRGFDDIQKAIELKPEFRGSYYLVRGQIYLDTGNEDLAISDFKKAIELATTNHNQEIINKATAKLRQLGVPGY